MEEIAHEELYNLPSYPDIKSRRMRWAGHVACMGEVTKLQRVWWESPKESDHSEEQGVGGRMGS
jgi:hypothetical protein